MVPKISQWFRKFGMVPRLDFRRLPGPVFDPPPKRDGWTRDPLTLSVT